MYPALCLPALPVPRRRRRSWAPAPDGPLRRVGCRRIPCAETPPERQGASSALTLRRGSPLLPQLPCLTSLSRAGRMRAGARTCSLFEAQAGSSPRTGLAVPFLTRRQAKHQLVGPSYSEQRAQAHDATEASPASSGDIAGSPQGHSVCPWILTVSKDTPGSWNNAHGVTR